MGLPAHAAAADGRHVSSTTGAQHCGCNHEVLALLLAGLFSFQDGDAYAALLMLGDLQKGGQPWAILCNECSGVEPGNFVRGHKAWQDIRQQQQLVKICSSLVSGG